MEQLWNEFWEIFRHGFDAISNPIVGVLIALIGGLMARSFVSVFIISALAVVLDVVAVAVTPMILHGSKVAVPPMDKAFLMVSAGLGPTAAKRCTWARQCRSL